MSTTVSHERTPRKAALASFRGSAVEYYDFFLFGSATALIFGEIGFLMAGFAPSIVAGLGGVREGGWVVISAFTAVICLIAAVSALTARETKDMPTSQLGQRSSTPVGI